LSAPVDADRNREAARLGRRDDVEGVVTEPQIEAAFVADRDGISAGDL